MRLDVGRWLLTLRKRKRAVLCALLPAFIFSTVATPACAAMARAPKETPAVHGHAHHDHAQPPAATDTPPSPRCPHCPLDSGNANVDHASCTIADAQSADAAYAKGGAWKAPPPIMDLRLPAASAAPPLITTALKQAEPFTVAIPLTLHHRVLLI